MMQSANTPDSLARFHSAQADPTTGYLTALGEIRAGRKASHWVWYIFPQLRGLGYSSMSERFGIAGAEEAEAYLRDPVLGGRLAEITRALEEQVSGGAPPKRVDRVLGGIDAMKVISCLTLFIEVARRMEAAPGPWVAAFRQSAERVLEAGAREGRSRCAFTLQKLAEPKESAK